MKKIIFLVCLFLSSFTAMAQVNKITINPQNESFQYIATQNDATIYSMISRWSTREGVPISWQAKVDYPIDDHESFNNNSTLAFSSSLNGAIHKTLKFINLKHPLSIHLQECVYKEGIIIQPVYKSCEPQS